MDELVSVIIPAFNSKQFISKCIDSVIAQSYKNIEIIVVNDGSTDNTTDIVKKYNNVILLNKKNGGLCSARNLGVENATGKYVVFVDSDDFIEKDFVMNFVNHSSNSDEELIMCDFLVNGVKESSNCQYMEMNDKETIFSQFLRGGIYNRTVNKMYPLKLLKQQKFPEGRDMLEDAYFTSHILEKCNRVIRTPYPGYNYIRHSGAMTRVKLNQKQLTSYYSNLLEKDVIISKYISNSCDYERLSDKAASHIKSTINAVNDLMAFNSFNNINLLLDFIRCHSLKHRHLVFCRYLERSNNPSILKKKFVKYILLRGSLKAKAVYLKSLFRRKRN